MARTTTPTELAQRIGIAPKQLRDWLRKTYPRAEHERYQRWAIDETMERRARDELRRR